ncbi:DMT family transporter [Microcella sp.]|uniref:DMT family transporter n=1 Tax=Microcella sp. TaxID=1913979 RepID=UPI003F7107FC
MTEPERPSRVRTVIAVGATVLAGVGVAVQSRVNGELGQRLDDGFTAALISFGSGWLILLVVLAVSPRGRGGMRAVTAGVRDGRLAWWMLLGGLAGALFVLAQGLVAGLIGVAIFTVAIVTGQTLTGLVVDATGFAGVRRTAIAPSRLIGAAITIAAVGVAVGPRLDGSEFPVAAIAWPLLAGLAIGFQQAVNGRVRTESQSALAATTINFTVGTAALFVAAVVHLLVAGLPESLPTNPLLYIGGAVGTIFIAIQTVTVGRIGVLVLGLSLIAGQLAAALVFDVVAPLGPSSTGATALAVGLAFAGVLVASIPTPRPGGGATRRSRPAA